MRFIRIFKAKNASGSFCISVLESLAGMSGENVNCICIFKLYNLVELCLIRRLQYLQ